jgi:tetratricopeptide (TPR) repeat protein
MIILHKGNEMAQKDYIVRIIEQLATFLFSIVFNKKINNFDMALEKIEEAYNGLLNTDGNKIKNIAFNEIIESNTFNGIINIDNIEIIASLLFEEADVLERINGFNIISRNYYEKSFLLFYKIYHETRKEKHNEKIIEILEKVNNYEIENETKYNIFKYYEEAGFYGKAEDYLYELIEDKYQNILEEGEFFYSALLEKEDDVLEKGNLSRNEVIEGISNIKQKYGA